MYKDTEAWANRFKETTFEFKVRTFAEEVFRVAEWATLVAAVSYIGQKYDSATARVIGYVLLTVLTTYVGTRVAHVGAGLLGPDRLAKMHFLYFLAVTLPVAGGLFFLINFVVNGLVKTLGN